MERSLPGTGRYLSHASICHRRNSLQSRHRGVGLGRGMERPGTAETDGVTNERFGFGGRGGDRVKSCARCYYCRCDKDAVFK